MKNQHILLFIILIFTFNIQCKKSSKEQQFIEYINKFVANENAILQFEYKINNTYITDSIISNSIDQHKIQIGLIINEKGCSVCKEEIIELLKESNIKHITILFSCDDDYIRKFNKFNKTEGMKYCNRNIEFPNLPLLFQPIKRGDSIFISKPHFYFKENKERSKLFIKYNYLNL